MQFRTLSIASILAAFVVLATDTQAAQCTKDQLKALEKLEEDDAMDQACPFTYDGSGSIQFEEIDPKVWTKMSSCANTTCVSYLKAQATKIPNCEIKKVNDQTHYNDQVSLCIDIASGKLSAAEIEKRLGEFADHSHDWVGGGSDDASDSGSCDSSDSGSDDFSDSGSDDVGDDDNDDHAV